MSNWIDYVLDVLANTTDEINQIAARVGAAFARTCQLACSENQPTSGRSRTKP